MAKAKKELRVEIMGSGQIDVDAIPSHVAISIGAATWRAVLDFLALPGGRECLEAKKAELRKQGLI